MKRKNNDSDIQLKKLLLRKLKEEQEELYWKKIPFSKKVQKYPGASSEKNLVVLRLLSYVPEFQKDVSIIRKKFGIKDGGFDSWYEIGTWAEEKNLIRFLPEFNGGGQPENNQFPSNPFEKEMLRLGIKYGLPFNFYAAYNSGISFYVISDQVRIARENWDINFRLWKDKKLLWASIVAYAPLNEREVKVAMISLEEFQLKSPFFFSKNQAVLVKNRGRTNLDRDLELLNDQLARTGMPKRVKNFKQGSYLAILSKNKNVSKKELNRQERKRKNDIIIQYNQPTSRQIGKNRGVSGEVARKTKSRLNALAKELFGYSLMP